MGTSIVLDLFKFLFQIQVPINFITAAKNHQRIILCHSNPVFKVSDVKRTKSSELFGKLQKLIDPNDKL